MKLRGRRLLGEIADRAPPVEEGSQSMDNHRQPQCSETGCLRASYNQGLCQEHYWSLVHHGDLMIESVPDPGIRTMLRVPVWTTVGRTR